MARGATVKILLLLAAGAVGQGGLRKPLFGQTEGDSNKCGAACEWYASAPVDGNDEEGPQAERMGLSGQLLLGEQPGQLEVARLHDDDPRPRND